jgi:hypothetical protein
MTRDDSSCSVLIRAMFSATEAVPLSATRHSGRYRIEVRRRLTPTTLDPTRSAAFSPRRWAFSFRNRTVVSMLVPMRLLEARSGERPTAVEARRWVDGVTSLMSADGVDDSLGHFALLFGLEARKWLGAGSGQRARRTCQNCSSEPKKGQGRADPTQRDRPVTVARSNAPTF